MKIVEKIRKARHQIAGVIIVAPVMILLFKLILPVLPSSPMKRDSFWAHKVTAKPVYDVVVVGDSRIYRGIDPQVVEAASGNTLRCFNFGFSSAGLDSFLLTQAKGLLDPNGAKILLIGISGNSFLNSSLQNEHLKSILNWNSKDIWIKRNIYPGMSFFDAYSVADLYMINKGERYFEDYHLESGFAASLKDRVDSGSALPSYREEFLREKYSIEAEEQFINNLLRLKAEGIEIVVTRLPVASALKKLEDESTGYSMDRLKQKLVSIGIDWIEPGGETYISYDGSHLTGASAKIFSEEIASGLLR
jgi:hypothetical protein